MVPPPPPRSAALPLAALAVGRCAIVAEVCAAAPEAERLAALGLVPGAAVRLLRGGASLSVAVGEARIGLGRSWAQALTVVPV